MSYSCEHEVWREGGYVPCGRPAIRFFKVNRVDVVGPVPIPCCNRHVSAHRFAVGDERSHEVSEEEYLSGLGLIVSIMVS
jgi:hypothetical protein